MYAQIRYVSVLFLFLVFVGLLATLEIAGVVGANHIGEQPATVADVSTATYDWRGEGSQSGSYYGEAVRSAGDVNCDGFDDAIVGAVNYDHSGFYDSGRAYLYYGSADGLSQTPDRIIEPPTIENSGFFGGMATTAGDVNNDNCDDVMISMVNYNGTYGDEGAVFVWYGSDSGLSSSHDWMARGNITYAHLGWDIGTAGDVNDDNYDDIIVGAIRYDGGDIAHAYVWFGSDSGLNEGVDGTPANADWTATTDQHCTDAVNGCSLFGANVGTAGDVNGDNIDDVYVGAPLYNNGESDEGVVFVWYGSKDDGPNGGVSGTPANAAWQAESNQADAWFSGGNGYMTSGAATAGDVNGDGIDDLIIGAYKYNHGQTDEGAAFVWLGSLDSGLNEGTDGTPENAHWMAESDQDYAGLGFEVSTAGDFNRDGYDDVLIGAWAFDITNTETITNGGQLMIWFGSDQGLGLDGTPANADWLASGDQVNGYLGFSVGSLGDVNADGGDDVIGGSPTYDFIQENNEGAAFAFYGPKYVYLPVVIK